MRSFLSLPSSSCILLALLLATAATSEATTFYDKHHQLLSLRPVERSDNNYAHDVMDEEQQQRQHQHHQTRRRQRTRQVMEFIPDFSISQDDGINIILPILDMQLFGTSGTKLSSTSKDIIQSSMEDYLQYIFEDNWWSTDSTTTTTSTNTTTMNGQEQRQDVKPILTNIRSEVLNDSPSCAPTASSSSSSSEPSCWNVITIQTILTFQDQGDNEESLIGNDNNNKEFQYNDSSISTTSSNTNSVPTQTELEGAASDAWTTVDLSTTYWKNYLLPTIQKEPNITIQEELINIDSIVSHYGKTDEEDTTTNHRMITITIQLYLYYQIMIMVLITRIVPLMGFLLPTINNNLR